MRRAVTLICAMVVGAGVLLIASPTANAATLGGSVTVSSAAISPNGDGCLEATTFNASMSWPDDAYFAQWSLSLVSAATSQNIVSSYTYPDYYGTLPPTSLSGTIGSYLYVPDGTYTVRLDLYVQDSSGAQHYITADAPSELVIDRSAPEIIEHGPSAVPVHAEGEVPGQPPVEVDVVPPGIMSTIYLRTDEDLDPDRSVIDLVTIDGVPASGSSGYNDGTNRLTYRPDTVLAGRYRATAVAMDTACNLSSRTWEFTIVGSNPQNTPAP